MSKLLCTVAASLLAAVPLQADSVLVHKKHTDAYKINGKETAAADVTSTTWIAKDKLRLESEGHVIIVRLDQKKLLLVDPKGKTWSAIDLPFDLKKYAPPEAAGMIDQMIGARALQVKVTPSDETKTIGAWTAKRYDLGLSQAGNQVSHEVIWASKDLKLDLANYVELTTTLVSIDPKNKNLAPEMRKVEGVLVRNEKSQSAGGTEIKSTEELVSIDEKEAAEGWYDVPAGYTEKPFDPMAAMMPGGKPKPVPPKKPGG